MRCDCLSRVQEVVVEEEQEEEAAPEQKKAAAPKKAAGAKKAAAAPKAEEEEEEESTQVCSRGLRGMVWLCGWAQAGVVEWRVHRLPPGCRVRGCDRSLLCSGGPLP